MRNAETWERSTLVKVPRHVGAAQNKLTKSGVRFLYCCISDIESSNWAKLTEALEEHGTTTTTPTRVPGGGWEAVIVPHGTTQKIKGALA